MAISDLKNKAHEAFRRKRYEMAVEALKSDRPLRKLAIHSRCLIPTTMHKLN